MREFILILFLISGIAFFSFSTYLDWMNYQEYKEYKLEEEKLLQYEDNLIKERQSLN